MFELRLGLKGWQRRILLAVTLVFGLAILSISLWRQSVKQVDVAIGSTKPPNLPQSLFLVPDVPGYTFPNPGILPDNPFYLVQMIRDRIETWAVRGTHEMVSLNLEHADIRLMVAQALLQKGQMAEGAESSVKAERYVQRAVDGLKHGTEVVDRSEWQRIYRTTEAHAMILQRFMAMASEAVKQTISLAQDENRRIQEDVKTRIR